MEVKHEIEPNMNKTVPTRKAQVPPKPDDIEVVPYCEQVDQLRVPRANDFIIERHRPRLFNAPFHHHTSVEINFLENCDMTYSFSGQAALLRSDRITVFWGAAPHRVSDVAGEGQITNIYLTLGQFVRWGLPKEMADAILAGAIICAKAPMENDRLWLDRLYAERDRKSLPWRRTHLAEIETRLRRLALEGWETVLTGQPPSEQIEFTAQTMLYVEGMLRYIADHFTIPMTVEDISKVANLSPSRAGKLFRDVMGVSIKQHVLRARLSHARMLLSETDAKIANIALDSGFPNLSNFYAAFVKSNAITPAAFRKKARRSEDTQAG